MAEWNDNVKHPKSSINNGQQYTKDDNVTLESLNNTIENSFYAVRVAENAQSATNNAVSYNAQTPLATEQIQAQKNLGIDQTIAFAESERQKSKNLFNINNTILDYSLNLGETGQQLNMASTSTESYGRCCTNINNLIKVKPNTQYVITTNSTFKYSLGQINASRLVVTETGWKTDSTLTITTTSTTEYVAFNFGKTDNSKITSSEFSNFLLSHIQIEEGSVATDYQPYNGQITHNGDSTVEFAENERQKSKNLFNYEDILPKPGLTTDNNGTFYIDTTFYYVMQQLNIPFELNKTYTMSCNVVSITGGDGPTFEFAVKYKDGEWVGYGSNVITGAGIVSASFTPTKEVDLFELRFVRQSTEGQELQATINNLQLEEGSTATDYQPYNGAIVHEKEIADVEHIKTIYDMFSSDSNINWGKTTGIKAQAQVEGVLAITPPVALKTTSKYRVYVNWGGDMNIFTASVNHSGTIISGCSATWSYLLYANQLQMCEFQYLSNINQIQFRFRNLTPGGASVEIQTSEYVYITKIEEIY